jgi:hypothetical protein
MGLLGKLEGRKINIQRKDNLFHVDKDIRIGLYGIIRGDTINPEGIGQCVIPIYLLLGYNSFYNAEQVFFRRFNQSIALMVIAGCMF